jgi:hypothetical protein
MPRVFCLHTLTSESAEDPRFAHPRRYTLRRKKDRIAHASGIHVPAVALGLSLFFGMVRSIVGYAARLGLILAEVCLLMLVLLLFDIAMF